jgi:ubiquinone/menaquinone biosynthesis C-methylase UbiE
MMPAFWTLAPALESWDKPCLMALDISPNMLEQSAQKQVYRRVLVDNAAAMTSVPDGAYQALICVGALNFGHIPSSALGEFLSVVAPDGLLAFTTRQDFLETDGLAMQLALVEERKWNKR